MIFIMHCYEPREWFMKTLIEHEFNLKLVCILFGYLLVSIVS